MELMNPCGVFETRDAPLAPRVVLGPDVTVGLFANDKKNADVMLDHVRQGLEDAFRVRDFRWFLKEATEPAAFTEEFLAECDAVIGAVCD